MKQFTIIFLTLTISVCVSAQMLDTVLVVQRARKFKASQHIKLMFEVLDTLDASGKGVPFSRAYYFDKQRRMISSVREDYNVEKPKKGMRVIYSFVANKLASVTVIPPKSVCSKCESEYRFRNDTLLALKENNYKSADPTHFITMGHYFQSKLPQSLPWGYFEDELEENGKMKRRKQRH